MLTVQISKYDSTKDTMDHKNKVQEYIQYCVKELVERSIHHDDSKLISPEKDAFDEYTPKLKNLTYGSEEYTDCLSKLHSALSHHYEVNSHHPEHFENGMSGMTLIDLVELICDWYAASQRHDDGDVMKSIQINKDRFGYDDMLASIFSNTIQYLKSVE